MLLFLLTLLVIAVGAGPGARRAIPSAQLAALGPGEGVAVDALGLRCLPRGEGVAAQQILAPGNWLQVPGIEAQPIAAQMVEFQTARYGPDQLLVGPAMRCDRRLSDAKVPMAICNHAVRPVPAGHTITFGRQKGVVVDLIHADNIRGDRTFS